MSPRTREWARRVAGEGATALARPDFRALIVAHAVSVGGYWLFLTTALTQLSEAGTAESSRLTALLTLPLVVLSPFTGLAVDRLGPKRTLMTAYAAGGVVLLGISTTDSVGGLYAGAVALSAVIALLRPSVFGLLSRTVAPSQIGPANGLLAAAGEASIMLGPLAAYALIRAGGSRPAFLAGAAAYSAAAVLLLRVASPAPLPQEALVGWRRRIGELLAGARSLATDPTIRLTTACLITLFGFIGALFTLEPNFLSDEVGVAKGSLGMAYAAAGLGSCVSALLVARRPARARPVPGIAVALAMVGVATAGYSTAQSLPEVVVWNLVVGLCFGQTLPPAFSVIQRRTPSAVIGRAMAAISIVQQAALGLVALLVGQVLPGDVRARVLGTGVALVLVGAVVFVTTRRRDDPPPPTDSPDAGGSALPAEQTPPVELAPAP